MTKRLVLVRHAKSDSSDPGQKDFDRLLNVRGFQDAPRTGARLVELGVKPDAVFSSPAMRARMTSEFVCEQLKYDVNEVVYDEELYEASVRSLLNFINAIEDKNSTVLMFGHNPTYTYIAEALSGKEIGNIPTCGAVSLTFEVESWSEVSAGLANLEWFIFPKDGVKSFQEEDEESV